MRGHLARVALCLAALTPACAAKSGEPPAESNGRQPAGSGEKQPNDISIGKEISLESKVLGEKRTIQIALPASYENGSRYTRYPVLYLLDGNLFFRAVSGDVRYLAGDASPRIPEMVVVGIASSARVRDSSPTRSLKGPLGQEDPESYSVSGGADAFLRFLTEELAPFIDRTYSTSGYRVLVGYSFTGLAVMHALFTQPKSFHAYVAMDPSWWWDDYLLEKEAARFIAGGPIDGRSVFVTTTTNNPPPPLFPELRYVNTLATMLEKTPVQGLSFGIRVYDDETHHSLVLRSLRDGLGHVFDGFSPTLDTLYAHPERLAAQYQAVSRRLGTPVFLQEGLVTYFGTTFLTIYRDVDKALLYFQLATAHYPGSANAWRKLGEAYEVKADRSRAIESYEKALQLDPSDEQASTRLKELRR